MFNKDKCYELLSKLSSLNIIYTKAQHQNNIVKIENNKILVATKKSDFKEFREIPCEMIEKVYNNLELNRTLSQQQINSGLNVKRSAFIIAALSLLPEIEYNRSNNSLKDRMKSLHHLAEN